MEQVKEYYQQWRNLPQPRKIKAIQLIAFVSYVLFLLLLVIYAFGRTGKSTSTIVPTILFTDGTPYNLEVIRYLAQRRDVVLGMIVVGANNSLAASKLRSSFQSVQTLMEELRREGYSTTVPLHSSNLSSPDNFLTPLLQYLSAQPAKFLVAGPCTEAAYFLRNTPESWSRVEGIYVGGGAFNVEGNANYLLITNTKAERNFFLDPPAAQYIVERSHGRPVTLLPLDAAMMWASDAFSAIVDTPQSTSSSAALISSSLQWYYDDVDAAQRTTVGILAAAFASDPQVRLSLQFTNIPVSVITNQTNSSNGRSYRPSSGNVVTVVIGLSADIFFGHLVNVDKLAFI